MDVSFLMKRLILLLKLLQSTLVFSMISTNMPYNLKKAVEIWKVIVMS